MSRGPFLDGPPYNFDDEQLVAAGDLVRRFHDAVAGTPLCGVMETVCHGDLGPHNTVFRHGRPVAIIDWDEDVGPGLRSVDFADAVWGFADLTSDSVPVAEEARRVAVMCASYPGMSPGIVVAELTAQFQRAARNHRAAGRAGPLAVFEDLIAWMDRQDPRSQATAERPAGGRRIESRTTTSCQRLPRGCRRPGPAIPDRGVPHGMRSRSRRAQQLSRLLPRTRQPTT